MRFEVGDLDLGRGGEWLLSATDFSFTRADQVCLANAAQNSHECYWLSRLTILVLF